MKVYFDYFEGHAIRSFGFGLGFGLGALGFGFGFVGHGFVAGMGLGFLVLYLGRDIRVAGLGLIC